MSAVSMSPCLAQPRWEPRTRPLEAEAAVIYAALFGGVVPAHVVERYEVAVASLPLEPTPERAEALWACPRQLAAVEYFLRLTRGKNGLSQRFQVVFYLAEIEPELFPRFARSRGSWLGGLADLGQAALAAPLRFGQGLWWWRRGPGA
jgi:hypothetical protein